MSAKKVKTKTPSTRKFTKRIQLPSDPKDFMTEANLPDELNGLPDNYTIDCESGGELYTNAIMGLVERFKLSKMSGDPQILAQNSIHQIITFISQLIPENALGQPCDVPQMAAIFGAAVGMGAAAAYDQGKVTLEEIEAQADCFYVAMREALPRGILLVRQVDKQIKAKKILH